MLPRPQSVADLCRPIIRTQRLMATYDLAYNATMATARPGPSWTNVSPHMSTLNTDRVPEFTVFHTHVQSELDCRREASPAFERSPLVLDESDQQVAGTLRDI